MDNNPERLAISCYIACPWVMKDYAREVRDQCVAAGVKVTSRWVDFLGDSHDPTVLEQEAFNDWDDVAAADVLLLLNLQKRGEETSGKAVETGLALALGKDIYMIGEPSNVFHYLEGHITRCKTVEEFIEIVKE